MNDTERAVMLVEAGKRAAEALTPTRDLVRAYPEVTLGCGLPVSLVRAIARVMGTTAQKNPSLYGSGGPIVIESASMTWEGVTVRCQGSRPMGAEDLPQAPACSECKGPLDEEARYGPEGTARCEGCAAKDENEDEAPPYRGNVCAEERAIDAGVRGGA